MEPRKKVILMYDFDETLAPGNMQEYAFIPSLKMSVDEFWNDAGVFAKKHNMDSNLAYMYKMVELAKQNNVHVNYESLKKLGENLTYFPGVTTWFKRINDFGKKMGLEIEHYIISSGTATIIEGTSIAKEFKRIYACNYSYDENGIPFWISQVVNYTNKTQFVYRIRKNLLDNLYNSKELNEYVEDRESLIPHSNMIYLGDGETDVPCMKQVKKNGGHSICVYNPESFKKFNIAHKLAKYNRVDFVAEADYNENAKLDKIIKAIIEKIAINNKLEEEKK